MKSIFISSPYAINPFTEDRRNYFREKRKGTNISVKQYSFFKEPGSSFLLDISTQGAAICCRKSYSEKTKLFLKITFEERVNFSLEGEVRHIEKKEIFDKARGKKAHYYQYGIKFIGPSPEFSDYLVKSRFWGFSRSPFKKADDTSSATGPFN